MTHEEWRKKKQKNENTSLVLGYIVMGIIFLAIGLAKNGC
jgi:hypothetical protein